MHSDTCMHAHMHALYMHACMQASFVRVVDTLLWVPPRLWAPPAAALGATLERLASACDRLSAPGAACGLLHELPAILPVETLFFSRFDSDPAKDWNPLYTLSGRHAAAANASDSAILHHSLTQLWVLQQRVSQRPGSWELRRGRASDHGEGDAVSRGGNAAVSRRRHISPLSRRVRFPPEATAAFEDALTHSLTSTPRPLSSSHIKSSQVKSARVQSARVQSARVQPWTLQPTLSVRLSNISAGTRSPAHQVYHTSHLNPNPSLTLTLTLTLTPTAILTSLT